MNSDITRAPKAHALFGAFAFLLVAVLTIALGGCGFGRTDVEDPGNSPAAVEVKGEGKEEERQAGSSETDGDNPTDGSAGESSSGTEVRSPGDDGHPKGDEENQRTFSMGYYDFVAPSALMSDEVTIDTLENEDLPWFDGAQDFSVAGVSMFTLETCAPHAAADYVELEGSPCELANGYSLRMFESMDKELHGWVSNREGATCEFFLRMVEGWVEDEPYGPPIKEFEARLVGMDSSQDGRVIAIACMKYLAERFTIYGSEPEVPATVPSWVEQQEATEVGGMRENASLDEAIAEFERRREDIDAAASADSRYAGTAYEMRQAGMEHDQNLELLMADIYDYLHGVPGIDVQWLEVTQEQWQSNLQAVLDEMDAEFSANHYSGNAYGMEAAGTRMQFANERIDELLSMAHSLP